MCGLLLMPSFSHAAGAIKITDTTAFFAIDFKFSEAPFDQEVPIAAQHGITYQDRVDTLGYTLESDNPEAPKATNVNAIVLSKSPVDGVRYDIPEGSEGVFTLVILATFAEPIVSDLRAYITKLPYFIDGRRTTVHQNQLDALSVPVLDIED